jgi:hypothetical protein
MAASAEDIQKAIDPLNATIAELQKQIEALKAQPAPGGPVQRTVAIEKRLADAPTEPAAKANRGRNLDELRRLAMTEPNTALRSQYQAELAKAELA